MTKHETREAAFIILYQMELSPRAAEEAAETSSESFDMPVNKAAVTLAESVWEKKDELDSIIGGYSPSRAVSRISKVNLSILRIAVYEIKYRAGSVPPKVAINEAIELTKAYSGENDKAFVNGVLNSFYKDLARTAD